MSSAAALDRLERISTRPAIELPARPESDADFDEKLRYILHAHIAIGDALLEERQFRHDVLIVLRELQCELARLRGE